MEYILNIKESCENGEVPSMAWVLRIEQILKGRKESMRKYSKTTRGMEKRNEAQRRYMKRKREKERIQKEICAINQIEHGNEYNTPCN